MAKKGKKGKRKGKAWGPGNSLYDWQQRNGISKQRSTTAVTRRKKGWTVKKVAKAVTAGAVLVVTGKDLKETYDQARAQGWSETDSAIYATTGIRKFSAQANQQDRWLAAHRVDWSVTARRVGEAIVFVGAPKVIDAVAKRLPADLKSAKLPLIGMPVT